VNAIGDEGYLELARAALEATDRVVAGVGQIPGLSVVVPPDSTLVALATDERCDVFTVTDEMTRRGWHVQPQLSFRGGPPTIHLSLSAGTAPHVEELLVDLRSAVEAATAAGPVQVDPDVAAFVRALDPAALTDADLDGLLRAVGMASGGGAPLTLPESMAEVNTLLDLADPALREALLTAFLDRLSRPSRGAGPRG
jgi:hypothetical protein